MDAIILNRFRLHYSRPKKINSLDDVITNRMADLYEEEKEQLRILPGLIEKTNITDLIAILRDHCINIKEDVDKMECLFGQMGAKLSASGAHMMDDIISRANKMFKKSIGGPIVETEVMLFVQYLNHFEIANIYTLVGLSSALRKRDLTNLLENMLSDKRGIDYRLSRLSQDRITELHTI